VTAVYGTGVTSTVREDALLWSYAGIAFGPEARLYVTNEASGTGTDDSLFTIDPANGTRVLFAQGPTAPEGLRFSVEGRFPLYVVEEDTGEGTGRLSIVGADGSVSFLCSGFTTIEDVALGGAGDIYVSEDGSGSIIRIQPPPPEIGIVQTAVPAAGTPVALGRAITYTFALSNAALYPMTGLVFTDTLPIGVRYEPDSLVMGAEWQQQAVPPPRLVLTGVLPAGGTTTISFRVTVTTRVALLLTNTATLASDQAARRVSNSVAHPVLPSFMRRLFLPMLLGDLAP
jgi:uncharacterized repeat protein (TIGR01451 family)